ncbi:MAG: coenzyme F420 hydrogenase [Firmicutes bacterium HGW-Firmicutes-10]|nr:MAG: coenzyme F420 hydrogenase [Firmicutes bacterium HGW-Firmicutes-10]
MKVSEFIVKKKYSEASGVTALVCEDISVELNGYGCYEEMVDRDLDDELDEVVRFVSPNLNGEVDESMLAEKLFGLEDDIHHDDRLGYYRSLYAGYVVEGDYRMQASSGGMGTWIFKELFENDLIDGVIPVKENPDKSSPIMFQYDISRSVEEIRAGAKTKYYPVELSQVLKIVREVEGRYAIIGIPSFIMVIRLLCEKDEIIRSRIKFTVGLICGHQKSSKFTDFLTWQVGIKPGDVTSIDYRKKLLDRPADKYGIEVSGTMSGVEVNVICPISELFGQDWGEGYFKVEASDFTDDVFNETADITVGDAWLPKYNSDSKGTSIIIIRNKVIEKLVDHGISSGRLVLDPLDKEDVFQSQASHYRHTHDELAYRLYKKDKAGEWRPKKRVEASNEISTMRKKVQDLREEIYTQSHIVFKKAVELDDWNYFESEMDKLSEEYKQLYRVNARRKKV